MKLTIVGAIIRYNRTTVPTFIYRYVTVTTVAVNNATPADLS